jgi:hypothetical protein
MGSRCRAGNVQNQPGKPARNASETRSFKEFKVRAKELKGARGDCF